MLAAFFLAVWGIGWYLFMRQLDEIPDIHSSYDMVAMLLFQITSFAGHIIPLLGPGMAAGAFAGERARGSLDLLLCTRLSSWSLVLEKWASACLPPLFLLLAFLPFYLFGSQGVSNPSYGSRLPYAGMMYAMLLIQTLTYTAMGIAISAYSQSTQRAIAVAYTVTIIFGWVVMGLISFVIMFILGLVLQSYNDSSAIFFSFTPLFNIGILVIVAAGSLFLAVRQVSRMRNG